MLNDAVVADTLRRYPHLFKIVTPIDVDKFSAMLVAHPNQLFRNEEVALSRYLQHFGSKLLRRMYLMPVHVVPKPRSSKFRLVNDQSAGSYSLNSMIRPESIKGVVLDGIPVLGAALRCFRRDHQDSELIMCKSDVSQVYRQMPVSPHWQIRQVVTIDSLRHVDQCNLFGGRGSLRVWAAFDTIIICKYIPTPQVHLLRLWDELGVHHEPSKQVHGLTLPVIGFNIDPNNMTVTLPPEGKTRLLNAINDFSSLLPGNRCRSLTEFQSFTGYANWAFNVFPLLKPALSNIYEKMVGKSNWRAGIYINTAVMRDLQWFKDHIKCAPGVHFLNANAWTPADLVQGAMGDEFALMDASGVGLGIYFPWAALGFHCALPTGAPTGTIFFFEALAICMAIHCARMAQGRQTHEVSSVDIMVDCDLDVHVDHIPGELNVIADTLSHGHLNFVRERVPGITLLPLIPPQDPTRLAWSVEWLVHERAIALGHTLDSSTKLVYSSALNSYLGFIHLHAFPIDPTTKTLSLFTTYMCHHIEPRLVDSYLSGICSELEVFYPTVCTARVSPLVSRTMKGFKRLCSKPVVQKRALSKDKLAHAIASFGSTPSFDDHLFLTILLTGFHALLRLDELVWPDDKNLQTYRKLSMHATVKLDADSFDYLLPVHKADAFFKGNRVLVRRSALVPNPYVFFRDYIAQCDTLFHLRPKLWIRANGSLPMCSWFMKCLRAIFPRDISGHSMCACF
ncbi:hypothetical protein C2E23DRAFT_857310 [Lenzites betulinus]|nr:hypothetical protein C2E23DRAFT_857310 [Lenzites betulinus]